jgi:hypothetical protein
MRSGVIFINPTLHATYVIKIKQSQPLGVLFIVIFGRAARDSAHNIGRDPLENRRQTLEFGRSNMTLTNCNSEISNHCIVPLIPLPTQA